MEYVTKTALTAYGLVGTDWVRMTLRIDGSFVRADGTDAPIPTLADRFRTCGDMQNATARLGHRVNVAAVPSVALPNHAWKGEWTLSDLATKRGVDASIVQAAVLYYSDDVEVAA